MELGTLVGPLLIFGGPYSNLSALRSLQAKAEELSITPGRIICTGDIVAYCGQPWESVELVRKWGIRVLMGNCEESFASGADDCGCGFEEGSNCDLLSVQWYRFANTEVSDDQRQWFAKLPRTLSFSFNGRNFKCVHGSASSINQFVFASSSDAFFRNQFTKTNTDVILAGHSGIPFSKELDGKLWHNSGALGMPANDGTPRTWYSIISTDGDQIKIETRPLEYDYDDTIEIMKDMGLDNAYARGLQAGLWPTMDVLPELERESQGQALAPQVVHF